MLLLFEDHRSVFQVRGYQAMAQRGKGGAEWRKWGTKQSLKKLIELIDWLEWFEWSTRMFLAVRQAKYAVFTESRRESDWHFWWCGRGHILFIDGDLCYSCYFYSYISHIRFLQTIQWSHSSSLLNNAKKEKDVLFYFAPFTSCINKTIPGCFQEHWASIQ